MYRAEKEAEAAERHREGSSKGGKAVENFPQPSESIKTRDELGEMAGMSAWAGRWGEIGTSARGRHGWNRPGAL